LKGVSFDISTIEKKGLSSNRVNNSINLSKSKKNQKSLNLSVSVISGTQKANFSNCTQTNSSSITTGERLYKLGKSMIEEKNKEISNLKAESVKKVKEECTFSPKLCDNSLLLSMKKQFTSCERVPYCLQTPAKQNKTIEVDLSPTKKKKKITEPTAKEMEFVSKLHSEREVFLQKKEKLREEHMKSFSFKPSVNDKTDPDINNFWQRQDTWKDKKKDKDASLLENSMMDTSTNQKFFSPIISKRSIELGNKKEIWSDLYNEHKTLTMKKEELTKKNIEDYTSTHKRKLISDNSDKISEELILNMIKKLFECLDCDEDKVISEDDFKNDHLNEEEQKWLKPLIDEKKKYNFEEFNKSIHLLLNTYQNKKILKNWFMNYKNRQSPKCCHNKNNETQFSFHPLVSDSSNEVMKNSQRHAKGFMERGKVFLERKMTMLNEKKEEELDKEYTFQPSLLKKLSSGDFKRLNSKACNVASIDLTQN